MFNIILVCRMSLSSSWLAWFISGSKQDDHAGYPGSSLSLLFKTIHKSRQSTMSGCESIPPRAVECVWTDLARPVACVFGCGGTYLSAGVAGGVPAAGGVPVAGGVHLCKHHFC